MLIQHSDQTNGMRIPINFGAPVSHEKVYKVTFKEKLLLCKIYENTLKCFFFNLQESRKLLFHKIDYMLRFSLSA